MDLQQIQQMQNQLKNNPMYIQFMKMTQEQQAQFLANVGNKNGITLDMIKSFLGK